MKISSFLQHGVNQLKMDNRISDFSDSKFIVQIINKQRQKQFSAGYLIRWWKNSCNSIQTKTTQGHHIRRIINYVLELRKIFNIDLKGLPGATGSGNKQEFLSFNLPELSVKPAVKQKSMNSTAKVMLQLVVTKGLHLISTSL